MDHPAYWEMVARNREGKRLENGILYLAQQLGRFLKRGEKVLICFHEHNAGDLGWCMEQAVLRCGAVPVIWGPDHRWKTLLQQAFYSRANTIIGPPLVILGLSKLKNHNGIPLYIRRAVMAGYPCPDWMIDGIVKGLDCTTVGCFGMGTTGVVAGFSCGQSWGVHLRQDAYGVDIVDDNGQPAADGEMGEMVLYPIDRPDLRLPLGENGRIDRTLCPCGCTAPRLMDLQARNTADPDLANLGQYLQSWTSVLDCRLRRGEYGLELELVVFAGEKLPKLPTAAKQVIRRWDPKHDEPFRYVPPERNWDFSSECY